MTLLLADNGILERCLSEAVALEEDDDFTECSERFRSLKAYSLVSRCWTRPSQKLLFSHVYLASDKVVDSFLEVILGVNCVTTTLELNGADISSERIVRLLDAVKDVESIRFWCVEVFLPKHILSFPSLSKLQHLRLGINLHESESPLDIPFSLTKLSLDMLHILPPSVFADLIVASRKTLSELQIPIDEGLPFFQALDSHFHLVAPQLTRLHIILVSPQFIRHLGACTSLEHFSVEAEEEIFIEAIKFLGSSPSSLSVSMWDSQVINVEKLKECLRMPALSRVRRMSIVSSRELEDAQKLYDECERRNIAIDVYINRNE